MGKALTSEKEKEIVDYLNCKFIRINAYNPNDIIIETFSS